MLLIMSCNYMLCDHSVTVLTDGDAAIVAGMIMLCEADSMKRDSSKKRSKLHTALIVCLLLPVCEGQFCCIS